MSDDSQGPQDSAEGERLQKVMAAAGVASRRVSENLIGQGRVAVNGEIVTEPGRRVLPGDRVEVDGTPIQLDITKRYVMLNKPVGVVSSMADESGRPDLREFTQDYEERLFNVGRLDAATSGLLVLTNDGELAHVLAHPSFGVTKTYIAKVQGAVTAQTISKLTKGIELDDGPIAADKARAMPGGGTGSTLVELTLPLFYACPCSLQLLRAHSADRDNLFKHCLRHRLGRCQRAVRVALRQVEGRGGVALPAIAASAA
jgi:23S rRNA pseudouridine2605 synthase/16S rRNA pseudouridine516 synthase